MGTTLPPSLPYPLPSSLPRPSCHSKIEQASIRMSSWDEHHKREIRHIQCLDTDKVVQAIKHFGG
jgi:hypothetical protein